MSDERAKTIRAIKTCLSDAYEFFNESMDALDEIGKGSIGAGMTPLLGGYGMKDSKDLYRTALIKLDSAQKALQPLAKRIQDGRVNETHFQSGEVMLILKDIILFDYTLLIEMLAERRGRETAWYRMKELSDKIHDVFNRVASQ